VNRKYRAPGGILPVFVARFVLSIAVAGLTAAQTGSDYRSRMRGVNTSGAFEAVKLHHEHVGVFAGQRRECKTSRQANPNRK
jgi:hypothetical protein